jgi:hypothetical protein
LKALYPRRRTQPQPDALACDEDDQDGHNDAEQEDPSSLVAVFQAFRENVEKKLDELHDLFRSIDEYEELRQQQISAAIQHEFGVKENLRMKKHRADAQVFRVPHHARKTLSPHIACHHFTYNFAHTLHHGALGGLLARLSSSHSCSQIRQAMQAWNAIMLSIPSSPPSHH